MTDKVCQSTVIIVKSGDTAFALRKKYPGIKMPDAIKIGQKINYDDNCGLCVEKTSKKTPEKPAAKASGSPCTGTEPKHLVVAGDALSVIAEKHKKSVQEIVENNNLKKDANGSPQVNLGSFLDMTVKTRPTQKPTENIASESSNNKVEPKAQAEKVQPAKSGPPTISKEEPSEERGLLSRFADYLKKSIFGGDIVVEKTQTIDKNGSKVEGKPKYTFRTDKTVFNYDEKKLAEYKDALPFIKFKEASGAPQDKVYLCSAGIKTAGYGQVMEYKSRYNPETGKKEQYRQGDVIDEKMLFIEWFNQDIYERINALEKDMPKDTPQNIRNAALSLAYNAGIRGVKTSKFFALIKKGDYDKAQGEMDWITAKMSVPKLQDGKPVYEFDRKLHGEKDIPQRNIAVKDPRTGIEYNTYQVVVDKKTKKPKELRKLEIDENKMDIVVSGLAIRRVEEMIVIGNGKISPEGMKLVERMKEQIANDKLSPDPKKHIDYIDSIIKNPQIIFDNMKKWDKLYTDIENKYKEEYLVSQGKTIPFRN